MLKVVIDALQNSIRHYINEDGTLTSEGQGLSNELKDTLIADAERQILEHVEALKLTLPTPTTKKEEK